MFAFLWLACSIEKGSAGAPDSDGDGFSEDRDCNDNDASMYPGNEEVCDGVDNDCDGRVDVDAQSGVFFADLDLDGFGSTDYLCEEASGYIDLAGDCDDSNPDINPAVAESCTNGVDDDCDGFVDEGTALDWYIDDDGDGFGDDDQVVADCAQPDGTSDRGGDCRDTDADVNPDASEVCADLIDNDCDGLTDDEDPDVTLSVWYLDLDEDGYGRDDLTVQSCDQPKSYVLQGGDCDDGEVEINPDAIEWCDDVDNDCDDLIDEADAKDAVTWYVDNDNDNFGDGSKTTQACDEPDGFADNDEDCDDNDENSYPDATELCDGKDNDCDKNVDNDTAKVIWYPDDDNDTFGDPGGTTVEDCKPVKGHVQDSTDCDDTRKDVNPDGVEMCTTVGIDDDCSGAADDAAAVDAVVCFVDDDGDGYGIDTIDYQGCTPPKDCALTDDDCQDGDGDINPGESEVCDGGDVDEDCNTLSDDDDPGVTGSFVDVYTDADEDGYGDPASKPTEECDADGYEVASDNTDCDDTEGGVFPGATELTNLTDDDCDELVDEHQVAAGDLVITEFMVDPVTANDAEQWFEVLNATGRTLVLDGWWFTLNEGTKSEALLHIPPEAGLSVAANNRLVFCADATAFDARASGATCDYEVAVADGGFEASTYGPGTDTGFIFDFEDELEIGMDGTLVDGISWTVSWPWDSGYTASLSETHLNATDNDFDVKWCKSDKAEVYTGASKDKDRGTPGVAGSCP